MSSERESVPEDEGDPASNAGGVDAETDSDLRAVKTSVSIDHDTWAIEGDYLVRTHRVPRTTLFSPLDVPDDPPPIHVNNIEALRVTRPRFAGETWPEYDCVEDCWAGRPSDARSLQNHYAPRTTLLSPLDVPDDPPPMDANSHRGPPNHEAKILRRHVARDGYRGGLLDGPFPWREVFAESRRRQHVDFDRRDTLPTSLSEGPKRQSMVQWRTHLHAKRSKEDA